MNKLQKWILVKIARKIVIQGNHRRQIVEFYRILIDAARNEFTEDTKPTLDCFLEDRHKEALNRK